MNHDGLRKDEPRFGDTNRCRCGRYTSGSPMVTDTATSAAIAGAHASNAKMNRSFSSFDLRKGGCMPAGHITEFSQFRLTAKPARFLQAAPVRYPARPMRVLLVTPPMTQLNTPYPATAYLTGFLRLHAADLGLEVTQADASIALFLRLFSAPLVARMADELRQRARTARAGARDAAVDRALPRARRALRRHRRARRSASCSAATRAWRCASSAARSCPKARASQRAAARRDRRSTARRFGALGTTEQARYLASLYVDDLADVWRDRHRPALRARALRRAARRERGVVRSAARGARRASRRSSTTTLDEITRELVAAHQPDVVAITAPFPGNVYGAFRMARTIRAAAPDDHARARRRLGQHRAARRCAIRACSTTSTT